MAFTFTVEDGTVVTGANSYVTVAYADDYFEIDFNFKDTWASLPISDQEYYLAWSTRILDQKVKWAGYRTNSTSALRWPRTGVYDADCEIIATTTMPRQLKEATCEFAKWLYSNDPTTGKDEENLKRIAVDVVEIEYQDDTSQSSYASIVNQILKPLGHMTVGGYGFGRITR